MPTPYHRAAVILRRARSVVVCAHVRPDGDAIGSTLALTLALRSIGVPAVPTLADAGSSPPHTYSFLPGFALFTQPGELEQPDVFISLDTPNLERLGDAKTLAENAESLVVIDHHPDNDGFGTVSLVDSSAAATAQLIWRLLVRLEVEPSPEIAMCCYVGLMTDTGRFQYDNTTPDAFRDAAHMLEAGVDPAEASRYVYQERSPASLKLQARAMSRMEIANDGKVAWTWIDSEDFESTGATSEETELLPDAIRQIAGIEVSVLLRSSSDGIRGNLRAKTGFDVGAVARELGGGGHTAAAGFTFTGTMEELLERLLSRLPGVR